MNKMNTVLKTFAENAAITSAKATELAGCGDNCAVRTLLLRGLIKVQGTTVRVDAKGAAHQRPSRTYAISERGLAHLNALATKASYVKTTHHEHYQAG